MPIETNAPGIIDDENELLGRGPSGLKGFSPTEVGAMVGVADRPVKCVWDTQVASTWTTASGGAVPTDPDLVREFSSVNDAAADDPPGPYNVHDVWDRLLP